jgi:hypothetical protein
MSIGTSGRIVIEIDPKKKRELYSELARDGQTLKNWFLENVDSYLSHTDHTVGLSDGELVPTAALKIQETNLS